MRKFACKLKFTSWMIVLAFCFFCMTIQGGEEVGVARLLEQLNECRVDIYRIYASVQESAADVLQKAHIPVSRNGVPAVAMGGNVDDNIVQLILINQKVNALLRDVGRVEEKRLEMVKIASSASRHPTISTGDLAMVEQIDRSCLQYYKEMQALRNRLENIKNGVFSQLNALPPPITFTCKAGIRFVLVRGIQNRMFYVSDKPVTLEQCKKISDDLLQRGCGDASGVYWCGITRQTAVDFVLALSAYEGQKFMLLESAQIRYLNKVNFAYTRGIASWLSENYSVDLSERRQIKSFGVEMAEIWDPSGALREASDAFVFGELPEGNYPQLGCYVVTGGKVGKQIYFAQLLEKYEKEHNGN